MCVMHWFGGVVDGDVERADVDSNRLDTHKNIKETMGIDGEGHRAGRG